MNSVHCYWNLNVLLVKIWNVFSILYFYDFFINDPLLADINLRNEKKNSILKKFEWIKGFIL